MGKVLHINEANFTKEVLEDKAVVLVDFWADWCSPCRMIAPVLEELAGELEGKAKITKVNVDENGGLSDQYGIRNIPTIVIFKDGKEQDRIVGFNSKESLKAKAEKYM